MHRLTRSELQAINAELQGMAVTQLGWCGTKLEGNTQRTLVEATTKRQLLYFMLERDVPTGEVNVVVGDVYDATLIPATDYAAGKPMVHSINVRNERLTGLLSWWQKYKVGRYTCSFIKTIPESKQVAYWAKGRDKQILADYLKYVEQFK